MDRCPYDSGCTEADSSASSHEQLGQQRALSLRRQTGDVDGLVSHYYLPSRQALALGPSFGKDLLEQFFHGIVGKLRYLREQVDAA